MDIKKIVKNNLYLILVLTTSLIITWPLFLPGYFSHHDDLQVMRIFEMRQCFSDLQIPCRWVPDMGYGNGYPLFNYYNPFIYYIGGLLSFILGYVMAAKALFLITALLGGISMFFLAREIFGKEAAIFATILYQFAPYKALDLYVRGALAEGFAMAIVPFCFFFIIKLLKEAKIKYFLGLSLSFATLLISHNIMSLFFIPFLFLFIIFWIFLNRSKNVLNLILSIGLGFGLAAFFIIPSFFEKNLVQIDNLTKLELDFRAHFVTVRQLFFDRAWGYGASFPGPNDTISLQIGWPHWIVSFLGGLFALVLFRRKNSKVTLLIFAVFIAAVFMTHIRSAFIWEKIGVLRFVQFPWRFLSIATFSASLLGGYLITLITKKHKIYLIIFITAAIVVLNWSYFKPQQFFFDINDQKKLSGLEWETQQKAAILDYLPQGAVQPREKAQTSPLIINGQAEITNFKNRSNNWSFSIKVLEDSRIEIPVFDFPNWQVWANNQLISHDNDNYVGRIAFQLTRGDYFVKGEFRNTPIRNLGNSISLISLAIMGLIIFRGKAFYEKI